MASAQSAGFPFHSKGHAIKTPYPGPFQAPVVRPLPPLSTEFPLHLQKSLSAESSPSTDEGYSTASTPAYPESPPGYPKPTKTTNIGVHAYGVSVANNHSKRSVGIFEDLGPLETNIAFDQLPDELAVYEHGSTVPSWYKRVYARIHENGERYYVPTKGICHPLRDSAVLHLSPSATDIHTPHSTVTRAAFTFAGECGKVVAKFPQGTCGSHHRLHNEALAYEAFPSYIAEHFIFIPDDDIEPPAAVNAVIPKIGRILKRGGKFKKVLRKVVQVVNKVATSPANYTPIPDDEFMSDGNTLKQIVMPPVVPKFYGYYLPAHVGTLSCHAICGASGVCKISWAQPILLMEDCGEPIDVDMMSQKDRELCAVPVKFLHDVAFVHLGIAPSKFVVQPGPLTVAPEMRSWAAPSYRVVGFGVGSGVPNNDDEDRWEEFEVLCTEDEEAVSAVLRLPRTA